jgi:hypothetical protein
MPDVISNVQTMRLNQVDDFMDEQNEDHQMFSHLSNQDMNLLSLDHLGHGPMLSESSSASSNIHQNDLQTTVDMSAIDPIITNYGTLSTRQPINCDTTSVESILHSDSDSLISDIEMIV